VFNFSTFKKNIMNKNKFLIALFLVVSLVQFAIAKEKALPEGVSPQNDEETISLRESCFAGTSQDDLEINNVRARLLGGGDLWWDLSDGRYIIPNVGPGEREVSSIFAAAIWIGGYDSGNNLRIAAQTYRQNGNDFWPGPIIDEENLAIDQADCLNWNEHFEVKGDTIQKLIDDYLSDDDGDGVADEIVNKDLDISLRRWPARNNPYFEEAVGFALPQDRDLAPFYDENVDGIYDPRDGDIPQIGVIGCEAQGISEVAFADQMIWWVYNDIGDVHSESGAPQIGMEIQALAFAFATNNAINNMSFYKYTLLNKATTTLKDTYIGQWVDPDLGCYSNDYVGCVVDESLGIVYNGTEADNDCDGVNGYRDRVPMLGVDYFRGPKDENGEELGMSAFIYYNNNIDPGNNPATTNPEEAQDFYGYLSGFWKDDSPVEFGGDGYGEGTFPTPYMFPGDPTDGSAWSECAVNNAPDDRRFVQSSGPFTLTSGATNEIIVGAVWVDDVDYPCPSFSRLLNADRVAQALFDNCFDIVDGPDAPNISIIELDQELILTLSNSPGSNNANEDYFEKDPLIPPGFQDSVYNFQGYAVYQLTAPTISCDDINNCDEAKLIAVVDIKDGVGTIVNYEPFDESSGIFSPSIKVQANNSGIKHSFRITDDRFATDNSTLINSKKYYFRAIAYAYNNYLPFDPTDFENTQQLPYLQGRRNIRTYTGIPHKNAPESGTVINAGYGDTPEITRIDGEGMGGEFLELTQESLEEICQNGEAEEITYQKNAGPFEVKVYDPLNLKAGTYTVRLVDTFNGDLTDSIYWTLEGEGVSFSSDKFIYSANEQLIPELGISISIQQTDEVYADPLQTNGFVGAKVEYADPAGPQWYGAIGDDAFGSSLTNYIKTATGEPDAEEDPNRVYSNILEGAWCPLHLTTFTPFSPDPNTPDVFLTPRPDFNSFIFDRGKENLPNVDIVLTSDKSKWSRCPVVNTFSPFYTSQSYIPNPEPDYFRIRQSPSKGKDGQEDGTGTGMSWFPGYAINVETGERLNVFFGENIFFGGLLADTDVTGYDMLWNPSTEIAIVDFPGPLPGSLPEFSFGAQHYIYVSNTKYDEGNALVDGLAVGAGTTARAGAWGSVGWTSFPFPNMELNSIEDGLIPNDVTFKLRVDNPFRITQNGGSEGGRPTYKFTIDSELVADKDNRDVAEDALDLIRAVPNPYYGYSAYESSSFDQKIKITNLPAKCKVSIYSLDGRLIRTYNRNAQADPSRGSEQLITSEEWDLKNEQGVNVASGVYIIHIDASESGLGEKVIKWFGGVRDFDATGL